MLIYDHLVSILFLSTFKHKAFSFYFFFILFSSTYFINVSNINIIIRSIDLLESVFYDRIRINLIFISFLKCKYENYI